MNTAVNEISKYLKNLTATNPICTALSTTFTEAGNLFQYGEPMEATQMISIIPYFGASPRSKDKYETSIQIRVKAKSKKRAGDTGQAIIEVFDRNKNICASANGIVLANNSNPMFLPPQEGGEWEISVCNFTVRHAKFN